MTKDDTEYEKPARGDISEAIRRKYCLENDHVYDSGSDDYMFFKTPGNDSSTEVYLCFA